MGCSVSSQSSVLNRAYCLCKRHQFKKHYNLGRKIGIGACAQVRLCYNIRTAEEHVVKIIPKPYDRKDIELEINLHQHAGSGECPYVVTFVDFFEDHRYYYFVMEYCSGGEIFSSLADRDCVTEMDIADIFCQILQGIAHIHFLGIVHRDIKPQNLIFSDKTFKIVKIIDFGLGYQMRKGKLLNEPCGAPEFLSPEMILGRYGRKVDIWSLGVVCYMLLFGSRPFTSRTDAQLFREIVEVEPSYETTKIVGDYKPSHAAISFCKLLLEKNFRKRPTAVEALNHPWLKQLNSNKFQTTEENKQKIPVIIYEKACKENLEIEEKEKIRQEYEIKKKNDNTYYGKKKLLKRKFSLEPHSLIPAYSDHFLEDDDKLTRVGVIRYSGLQSIIKEIRDTEC